MRFKLILVALFLGMLVSPSLLGASKQDGDQPVENNQLFRPVQASSVLKAAQSLAEKAVFSRVIPVRVNPKAVEHTVVQFPLSTGINIYGTYDHDEIHGEGNRSVFYRLDGVDYTLSSVNIVRGQVTGEFYLPLGTPGGSRYSIVNKAGETYFAQRNEETAGRLLGGDWVGHAQPQRVVENFAEEILRNHFPIRIEFREVDLNYGYIYDSTSIAGFAAGRGSSAVAEDARLSAAQTAVDQVNITIHNSRPVGNYRVQLVSSMDYEEYTSQGNLLDDLRRLEDELSSPSSRIASWREANHIDLVSMWVDPPNPNYGGLAGVDCHVSYVPMGGEVDAHEIAHNFGMGHQAKFWGTPNPLFALDWCVNGKFRTAVAYPDCPDGCPLVPIYANPNVLIEGIPAGDPGKAENWRMLDINFARVAAYHN